MPGTLVELLEFRARVHGEARAYTFLLDGEVEQATLTYRELNERSRAIAATLQANGIRPGERALLLAPQGLDFIAAFFGCLAAGVVAVPVEAPDPAGGAGGLARMSAIAADAGLSAVLCTQAVHRVRAAIMAGAPALVAVPWIVTDGICAAAGGTWRDPGIRPSTLAFLQYTSGSTAEPKGVMVSHGNLLHNLAYADHVEENDSRSVSVSWLPLHHDMGLIEGVLEPVYAGYPAYLMTPAAFVQRPVRWLQAISRFGATNSGGPNFAYELCVRKITPEQRAGLDLRTWRVAYNGAEPIRADTLHAFFDAFAPCGFRWSSFYPVFGLAEATLLVSSGGRTYQPVMFEADADALGRGRAAPQDARRTVRLVSSGPVSFGTRVVVADPETRIGQEAGRIGEVWVASPSVAQGYWRQPEASEHVFRAYLADTGEGPFLRTGDLGFLLDGELFIAGRLKDVLIVRGLKVFPQDVERPLERRHAALRPGRCAVFAVDDGARERLVVVAELDPRNLGDHDAGRTGHHAPTEAALDEVIVAIRRGIAEEHGLQIHALALVRPGGVPRTSSGKVRRHACRAAFLAGTLDELARWTLEAERATLERRGADAVVVAAPESGP